MITRAPRRRLHGAVAAGKSLPATWKHRSPALSPGHFTVPPRTRSSLYPLSRATRKAARATSPSASTAEPPLAMASTLESSSHHLDPSDAVAMARGSFSPPQSDTRATVGAHRELAAGRSTAAVRNRGNTSPRRPHAHAPGARGPQREWRGMDLVHHGPCLRSMDRELASTVDHACGPQPIMSPRLRHGRATTRHVSGSARPRPAHPEPTRAQFGPSPY